MNIGYCCSTTHVIHQDAHKIAFRWISSSFESHDFSFKDLEEESNRFANSLMHLNFVPGDIFFTFLPKCPEQFFAFIGSLKLQLITGTLFSNFGEDALFDRLGDAKAKGVITKKSLLKKVLRVKDRLPCLKTIILVDIDEHLSPDVLSYKALMVESSTIYTTQNTSPNTPSVLHYTSGTTGKPKGVLHVHGSIEMQIATTRDILQVTDKDIYWCTADQGWVTGTSYGIIGPWCLGITQIHYGGGYDAETWLTILEREKVTVWYSAPTALRMLMREDSTLFKRFDLSHLRHICSVGEPLNPEVINWAKNVLRKDIYDTWFQTETGAIMIANRPGLEIRPGSMGKPVDGITAAIIDSQGNQLSAGEHGDLCLKAGWTSMFRSYLNNQEVYKQKFRDGWYYTGDTAWQDKDGYFWFMGRSDDVINTAGHLVSPFEIESALLEIEEVAESGVVGVPDALLFEKVVAFINLKDRIDFTSELELKIRLYVSNKVSSLATPQEIIISESIPKNKSGKILRRVLKARYLGIDAGDVSTLEI